MVASLDRKTHRDKEVEKKETAKEKRQTQTMAKTPEWIAALLPKSYDPKKAVLAMVIILIVFIVGALSGGLLPWWISVIIAVVLVFGAFVGMAQFDNAFECKRQPKADSLGVLEQLWEDKPSTTTSQRQSEPVGRDIAPSGGGSLGEQIDVLSAF